MYQPNAPSEVDPMAMSVGPTMLDELVEYAQRSVEKSDGRPVNLHDACDAAHNSSRSFEQRASPSGANRLKLGGSGGNADGVDQLAQPYRLAFPAQSPS